MGEPDAGQGDAPIKQELDEGGNMLGLKRFLCFGTETGKCTTEEQKLTREKAGCVVRLIETGHGEEIVREIVKFSVEGRAHRQEPLLFALAICVRYTPNTKNPNHFRTKQAAYSAVGTVCRIPTHLFTFQNYCKTLSTNGKGYGRAYRRAFAQWYLNKPPKDLAYLVTKYVGRGGWTHKDVLRLSHPKTEDTSKAAVLKYVSAGYEKARDKFDTQDCSDETRQVLDYLHAVHTLKHTQDGLQAAALIREHKLVREHVPTWLNKNVEVWRALIEHIPMEALVRSLCRLGSLDLLQRDCNESELVIKRLKDEEALLNSRLHPITILNAKNMYEKGKTTHKDLRWEVNTSVVAALDDAFYICFKNVAATGKRFLLALDITTSMQHGHVTGSRHLSPVQAAAMMITVTLRREEHCDVISFSSDVQPIDLKSKKSLKDVVKGLEELPKGLADCASPIRWALENRKPYDVIMVYTDSEPIAGAEKPSETIQLYRSSLEIPNAKYVLVAMGAQPRDMADPEDRNMLDVIGLDTHTPGVIEQFINDAI